MRSNTLIASLAVLFCLAQTVIAGWVNAPDLSRLSTAEVVVGNHLFVKAADGVDSAALAAAVGSIGLTF